MWMEVGLIAFAYGCGRGSGHGERMAFRMGKILGWAVVRWRLLAYSAVSRTTKLCLGLLWGAHRGSAVRRLEVITSDSKWFSTTRLETRTKESNMCASIRVNQTLKSFLFSFPSTKRKGCKKFLPSRGWRGEGIQSECKAKARQKGRN